MADSQKNKVNEKDHPSDTPMEPIKPKSMFNLRKTPKKSAADVGKVKSAFGGFDSKRKFLKSSSKRGDTTKT